MVTRLGSVHLLSVCTVASTTSSPQTERRAPLSALCASRSVYCLSFSFAEKSSLLSPRDYHIALSGGPNLGPSLSSLQVAVAIGCMGVRVVIRALPVSSLSGHHGGRCVRVHSHVAHRCRVGAWVAAGASTVRLVYHRLDDSPSCIDEPIVDLKDGETSVLGELLLLVLRGVWVGEVLEQPGSQDVGCHFWEDPALFRVL